MSPSQGHPSFQASSCPNPILSPLLLCSLTYMLHWSLSMHLLEMETLRVPSYTASARTPPRPKYGITSSTNVSQLLFLHTGCDWALTAFSGHPSIYEISDRLKFPWNELTYIYPVLFLPFIRGVNLIPFNRDYRLTFNV